MTMQAEVTQEVFDSLPEHFQGEYQQDSENTDSYLLDVAEVNGYSLANVPTLKSALEKERTDHKTVAKQFEEQTALFKDIDATAAKEALEKMKEMDDWDPEKKLEEHKAQFESQLNSKAEAAAKQLTDKYTGELKTRDDKIGKMQTDLSDALIDSAAIKALTELEGSVDLLLPIVKKSSRIIETDSGFQVEIFNSNGVRISTAPNNNDPMTIVEFVSELRNDPRYARAFDGSGASGGGASGSDNNNTGGSSAPYIISEADGKDPAKYRKAKAAAEKAGRTLQVQYER